MSISLNDKSRTELVKLQKLGSDYRSLKSNPAFMNIIYYYLTEDVIRISSDLVNKEVVDLYADDLIAKTKLNDFLVMLDDLDNTVRDHIENLNEDIN